MWMRMHIDKSGLRVWWWPAREVSFGVDSFIVSNQNSSSQRNGIFATAFREELCSNFARWIGCSVADELSKSAGKGRLGAMEQGRSKYASWVDGWAIDTNNAVLPTRNIETHAFLCSKIKCRIANVKMIANLIHNVISSIDVLNT